VNAETLYIEQRGTSEIVYRWHMARAVIGPRYKEPPSVNVTPRKLRAYTEEANRVLRVLKSPSQAQELGSQMYRELVPEEIRSDLAALVGQPLQIATSLVGVPWELFHDGVDFWALRYALGRSVPSETTFEGAWSLPPLRRALIIGSDPGGDLPFVDDEITELLALGIADCAEPCVLSAGAQSVFAVQGKLSKKFDLIHYTGHIDSKAALLLAESQQLTLEDIRRELRGNPIVFLNGCAGSRRARARGAAWQRAGDICSVADAFVSARAGQASAVVATLCDVLDADSAKFALEFYTIALKHVALGEALRLAREGMRKQLPQSVIWLSYVLYGDPALAIPGAPPPPPPPPPPAPSRKLFKDDGTPDPSSWDDSALLVLNQAIAEAFGEIREQAGLPDILLAIVGSGLLDERLVAAGRGPRDVLRSLRGNSGGPVRTHVVVRHGHFPRTTHDLFKAAQQAAVDERLGAADLLVTLVRSAPPEIEARLKERLGGLTLATLDPTLPPPPPPSIFDRVGQLESLTKIDRVLVDVFTHAEGERTATQSEQIEPIHLLVAFGFSTEARRVLQLNLNRKFLDRFFPLREEFYSAFGHSLSPARTLALPEHRGCSISSLDLIRATLRLEPLPLSWRTFLEQTKRAVSGLAADRDEEATKVVCELVDWLQPVGGIPPPRANSGGRSGSAPADSKVPDGAKAANPSRQAPRQPVARKQADTSPAAPPSAGPSDLHAFEPLTTTPMLQLFGRDLVAEASAGRLTAPLIGRDQQLRLIALTLARKDKANVLLVGEAGVGKTAIIEGLAVSIALGTAPLNLRSRRIIELDTGRLIAGTSLHGELEARVQALLAEVAANPEVVLFVDEFHTFINAGGHGERTALTLGNQLKSALGRGHISIIAATTAQECALTIDRDPAFKRRFRMVSVPEPSPEETLQILRASRSDIEQHYGASIDDEALEVAVRLATPLPGHLPDKARDLVVDACAALSVGITRRPSAVTAADIRELVARMRSGSDGANMPTASGATDIALRLSRRVIGQPQAIDCVANRLSTAQLVRAPGRPVAVFFFTGTSGVGKTELARALAVEWCGTAESLTVIPMNEYSDRLMASRLLGVGPGWAGHDEEPLLIGALKARARRVIVFDEIDKAHHDVWKILLRLFDEGIITDARNNTEVNGREAIYVLTANLALAGPAVVGFCDDNSATASDTRLSLCRHFPAEFVNRIDDVVELKPLAMDAVVTIAQRRLDELATWVQQEHAITVTFPPAVARWVADRAYAPEFGAREINRVIDRGVHPALGDVLCADPRVRLRCEVVDGALRFAKDQDTGVATGRMQTPLIV